MSSDIAPSRMPDPAAWTLAKFIISGGSAAALFFVFCYLFAKAGAPPFAATIVAYGLAFAIGYGVNGGAIPGQRGGEVGHETLADRAGMPTSAVPLTSPAPFRQHGVQLLEARRRRDRGHEVGARVFDQALDLALVVALARTAEPVLEQAVADQLGESTRPFTLAVAADLGHRDRRVVVQNRQRHAAKEAESRHVTVEERLRRLLGIGLHEAGIRLRQVQAEEMDLLAHPTDHCDSLAKIHLRVARRVSQGHEGLPPSCPADPHVILHDGVAAREPMLVTKPLEDPLGRVTLLHRRRPVSLQNGIDDGNVRPQLRLLRRLRPRVAGRHGKPAHLQNRLAAQPEDPGCLPATLALHQHEMPNGGVDLHGEHPRPPQNGQPIHWPEIPPPASAHHRRFSGLFCHRRAHTRRSLSGVRETRSLPARPPWLVASERAVGGAGRLCAAGRPRLNGVRAVTGGRRARSL